MTSYHTVSFNSTYQLDNLSISRHTIAPAGTKPSVWLLVATINKYQDGRLRNLKFQIINQPVALSQQKIRWFGLYKFKVN